MKTFLTLVDAIIVEEPKIRNIRTNEGIYRRRYTFHIRNATVSELYIIAEGLDSTMTTRGPLYDDVATVIIDCGGFQLCKVLFNPSNGTVIQAIKYKYDRIDIAWTDWLFPWIGVQRMRLNQRRQRLPHLGINGMTTCLRALLAYLQAHEVVGVIDTKVEIVMLKLRNRHDVHVEDEVAL